MAITFRRAKEYLAQYAGRGGLCADDPEVDLFVLEVLQNVLFKGPSGALRTYCFQARRGCITLPYELETPLKIKIDNKVGSVWSQWFQYYDTGTMDHDCLQATALQEEAGYFPVVYDLPIPSQVGVLAIADEAPDAHLIVKGIDPSGREVFTVHNGEQISGEYLSLRRGVLVTSHTTFAKITHVVKTKSNGYVQLLGVNPSQNARYFLSDYSPLEEVPSYRRFRLRVPCKENALVNVLGRIRLKENYADSDPIPIENIAALKTAAQARQMQENKDYQGARFNDQQVEQMLIQENNYKKVAPGQPMEIFHATSPGTIRNIVSGFGPSFRYRRWR